MLQQMLIVIRGMKDPKKIGTLNGAIAARLTALYGPAEAARIYRATANAIEHEHPEAIPDLIND